MPQHYKCSGAGNGSKTSGFAGLPGGYRNTNGNFNAIGANGGWWSSSEDGTSNAWFRDLNNNYGNVNRYTNNKQNGFSVRCLRD